MPRILLVDDEPAILETLSYALRKAEFEALVASNLAEARQALLGLPIDLVILDLGLPDGDGLTLLREMRQTGARPAVIVLSSRSQEADRIAALDGGADDYVSKPFSPREMVSRARAVLRRAPGDELPSGRAQPLIIDGQARRVHVLGSELDLTRAEFDILALLLSAPGHVFSRAQIINQIWGSGFALSTRTIDSHIKALRRKLMDASGDPNWIETVRGIGYRAEAVAEAP